MHVTPDIDVIPAAYSSGPTAPPASGDPFAARKRWLLLLLTFVLCAVIGLAYVWLRAPVYQSYAILHLSYSQPQLEGIGSIAAEQLNIHRQRLASHSLLGALSVKLLEERGLSLSPEQLDRMLGVEALADSRLLKLSATGSSPEILQPVVATWIDLYNSLQSSEQQDESGKELTDLRDKLAVLERKVADRRTALAEFAAQHQIVSLERDENRILNQIKGLSNSLDVATEESAAAAGELKAISAAIASGKIMVRPQDQSSLDNMEDRALALEEQLFQLSQQYTPEYMALDPKIVAIKNNLVSLRDKIDSRRRESQATYQNEAEQTLRSASLKEANIREQLAALQNQAQAFSQKLGEYNSQTLSLEQLEEQAQLVQQQLIEAEVRKPYQAELVMLERPLRPEFPIGPAYGRDSGLVLLGALLLALVTVAVYSLMNRQPGRGMIFSSYAVIQPEQKVVNSQLGHQPHQQIAYRDARELSTEECRTLIEGAPLHCRLILQLMLSGVGANELLLLKPEDFDPQQGLLALPGQYPRQLRLPEPVAATYQRVGENSRQGSLWQTPDQETLALPELELMLRHTSEAAGVLNPEPATLKDLRFTYLLFLAGQGATLSQIEQVAGYLSAKDMESCRQSAAGKEGIDLDRIVTYHPALA